MEGLVPGFGKSTRILGGWIGGGVGAETGLWWHLGTCTWAHALGHHRVTLVSSSAYLLIHVTFIRRRHLSIVSLTVVTISIDESQAMLHLKSSI